ncbi:MAG TPA: ABC transporter substrate-binding protein [Beijerinckiaceae bacterium]|nr:ABC transporter substrate-binding protein [Beijerinckiaceae bacterium]
MKKTYRTGALALSTLGFIGLALQGSVAAQTKPYNIDVILPLTGGVAFLGKEEKESLQLVEPIINKAGGIRGRKVHFVYYDDQTNPQTSVQLATRLIAAKPSFILGSSLVSSCNAMAPLMTNGPVMYCFSPGIHPKKGSFVFTATVSTRDLAAAQIRYFRLKGWTKIAIMTSADATGQDVERGLNKLLARPENKSMKVVARAHFNITDVSVSAQIEKIKQAKPQALIAWATGSPIATVFKGIVEAGLNIPIATTQGNMTYAQMKQYASFLPKQLYFAASLWAPHKGVLTFDPGVEKAQRLFFGAYKGANLKPDAGATLSWDPALILVHALRHLGPKPTAAQVRDYIAQLKGFPGINGIYNFPNRPQRGLDINAVIVTRWSAAHNSWKVVGKQRGVPISQ